MKTRNKYFLFLILVIFHFQAAFAANKLICSHSVTNPAGSEGIQAEIIYCKDAISDTSNRCGAKINERFGVSEKFIDGNTSGAFGTGNETPPSTEGVCKISIPPEEYSNVGIFPNSYGKPASITLYISPIGCILGDLTCSDFVTESIVVNQPREFPPPDKLICSSSFINPATQKSGVQASIRVCSGSIGAKDRCSIIINDVLFEQRASFSSGPRKPDECSFFIHPDDYSKYGITEEHLGKAIEISLVFSPSGCITGDPTCSEAATELVVIEKPRSTKELKSFITNLKALQKDLLLEFEETSIKGLQITVRKINRVIKIIKSAIEHVTVGDLTDCSDNLSEAIITLEKVVDEFKARQCIGSIPRRGCIPKDIIETFIIEFEDLLNDLEDAASLDDNQDDIPDICGS